jgi:hypothetical protein
MVSRYAISSLCILAGLVLAGPAAAALPAGYPGLPYQGKVQEIPGRVFLSDFDQGPKNVVWHDYNTKNQWACKVRDSTGVGLQLMGQGGDKGDTPGADSLVKARMGKCYLAETNQGDWTKYTVKVAQPGSYTLSMLSAEQGTDIPFVGVSLLQGADSAGTGKIVLPLTTYFHHWVYTRGLATMDLDSGLQVLRFDIIGNGPMNVDFIDFAYAGAVGTRAAAAAPEVRIEGLARAADGRVRLRYAVPGAGRVDVRLYDAGGKDLARAVVDAPEAGPAESELSLPAHAPGLVFVRLVRAGRSVVRALPLP